MGYIRWIGNAMPVVQVWSLTITTNNTSTMYSVSINGKKIAVYGNSGGASATATSLAAALTASTTAEFQEVTWTANAASVLGTAKTAGKPFVASAAVSSGAGAIGSVGDITACTGPNFLDNVANWQGRAPVTDDEVFIENSAVDILYNLSALQFEALSAFNVAASYTGNIGLLQNAGKYQEYRGLSIAMNAARVNIGYGPGPGSPRVRISSINSVDTVITVSNTGSSNEPGLPAFCWDGEPGAGSSMQVLRGSVGIGMVPGQAAGLNQIEVGYVTNVQGDAQVIVGPGGSAENYVIAGGSTVMQAGGFLSTLQMSAGTVTVYGTDEGGEFTINGGTLYWNSTAQLGSATNSISGKGTLDFSQDMQPKTFVTGGVIYASKGATINDPSNVLACASGYVTIEPRGCSLSDLNLNFGYGRRVQV